MIQFSYPLALFALLAVPAILILYSLRPRRQILSISTNKLWREALRERQRGMGWQKLLRDLSLWLLLVAAVVLAAALAGLQWSGHATEGDEIVVVVDVSASMQASGDRFNDAISELGQLIDGLPDTGRMAIIASGASPRLLSAFTGDKELLRRIRNGLAPTDEAGAPRSAIALALTLVRHRSRGQVHFLTDGAFDGQVDFASPLVKYHLVGTQATPRNIAITRFEFRREIASEQRFQMFARIRNYTDQTQQVPIQIILDRRVLYEDSLTLPADTDQSIVVPFRGRVFGDAQAVIEFDDDLTIDNRAFAVLAEDEGLRVLLYTPGNFYLEGALAALPNVRVSQIAEAPDKQLAAQARTHDLIIFDRSYLDPAIHPKLPPGNYLAVDTVPPGSPFATSGNIEQPVYAGIGASPLVRGLDLSSLKIASAKHIDVNPDNTGIQRLFWSTETDLALSLIDTDIRMVYLGFDLAASNLPLQAAFPLLVKNSIDWLQDRTDTDTDPLRLNQLSAGMPFTVSVPGTDVPITVTTPDGDGLVQTVEPGQTQVAFVATQKTGIYRYTVGQIERRFAVNLTDEAESDIRPRAEIANQSDPYDLIPTTNTPGAQVTLNLWPYAVMLALIVLLLEWTLWCARRGSA